MKFAQARVRVHCVGWTLDTGIYAALKSRTNGILARAFACTGGLHQRTAPSALHSAGSCANKAPCKAHGHSRHRFTSLYIIYTHELLTHYTRLKTQLASPPLHIIHRSMPACACALSSAVIVRTHAEARALSSWRHGRAAWRPPSAGASVRACARPTAPAPARRPSPQRRGRRRRARRVWPLRR